MGCSPIHNCYNSVSTDVWKSVYVSCLHKLNSKSSTMLASQFPLGYADTFVVNFCLLCVDAKALVASTSVMN